MMLVSMKNASTKSPVRKELQAQLLTKGSALQLPCFGHNTLTPVSSCLQLPCSGSLDASDAECAVMFVIDPGFWLPMTLDASSTAMPTGAAAVTLRTESALITHSFMQ